MVDQVTLTLQCNLTGQYGSAPVEVYSITEDWSESEVTWNNQPDPAGSLADTFLVNSTTRQPYTADLTGLVEDWVDGTTANYGVMLKLGQARGDTRAACASSDNGTAALRPELEIDWHTTGAPITRTYSSMGSQRIAMRVAASA